VDWTAFIETFAAVLIFSPSDKEKEKKNKKNKKIQEQEEQEQEFICSSRRYCGSGEAGVLAIIWLRWSAMFWSFAIILVKSLVIRSDGRALRPIYASRSIQVTSKQVAVRNVTHDRGGGVCRTRGTDH